MNKVARKSQGGSRSRRSEGRRKALMLIYLYAMPGLDQSTWAFMRRVMSSLENININISCERLPEFYPRLHRAMKCRFAHTVLVLVEISQSCLRAFMPI